MTVECSVLNGIYIYIPARLQEPRGRGGRGAGRAEGWEEFCEMLSSVNNTVMELMNSQWLWLSAQNKIKMVVSVCLPWGAVML